MLALAKKKNNTADGTIEYEALMSSWREQCERAEYWRLTQGQKNEVDKRWNSIPAPKTVRRAGLLPMSKPSQLWCSDWLHVLFFIRYLLCGIVKADILNLMADLCNMLSTMVSGKVQRTDLPELRTETVCLLTRMEALCPASCLSPTVHVLCHVWDDIEHFGSWQGTWCFPWERWMRTMRTKIRSTAFPCKNYINRHLLCSRLPLLSDATLFQLSLLVDQLGYAPTPLLSSILFVPEERSDERLMGRVKACNAPSLDINDVRECIARTCSALRSLLKRAKTSYASYTYRESRKSREGNCMSFEDWMESSSFRGLSLGQMAIRVGPGWRRGSSTFSSRIGELPFRERKAKILRSFCWVKGSAIDPSWRGAWFGRIYFFLRVTFALNRQLHSGCQCGFDFAYGIAAVRVFAKDHISMDQFGYTASFTHGLEPQTHFIRWDGIGGRVVFADHPENENKKIILDIDNLEYPRPDE